MQETFRHSQHSSSAYSRPRSGARKTLHGMKVDLVTVDCLSNERQIFHQNFFQFLQGRTRYCACERVLVLFATFAENAVFFFVGQRCAQVLACVPARIFLLHPADLGRSATQWSFPSNCARKIGRSSAPNVFHSVTWVTKCRTCNARFVQK